ncbi:MAG: hypothetical protein FWE24_10990 [Defluviitaleaceae bacterium]|nr:hypothetical protein [Defluviitaleaceae bacterium]
MLIPETSGAKGDMYIDIYNYKAKYINDSIIAEAAIRCHCTLITSDDRLFKKVNKHFPGKVISLSDYLKQIS